MTSYRIAAALVVALLIGALLMFELHRPASTASNSTSSAATPPAPPSSPALASNNSEQLYTAAFELMDQSPDETRYLLDPQRTPLDAGAAAFLRQRAPIIELLVKGSTLPAMKDRPVPTDMALALQPLNRARGAALLLVLQSRYELQNGHPDKAVEAQLAGLALARDTGAGKLLVARLVECAVEALVTDSIAKLLPQMPRANVEALRDGIAKLPKPTPISATLAAERDFGIQSLKAQTGMAPANLAAFYDAVIPTADGTPAEFQAAIAGQMKKYPYDQFLKILVPSLERMGDPLASTGEKRAMLMTAIDVVLNGADAVANSKDPFASGPFKYAATKDGFVLTSALKWNDKAVELHIGPG